MHLALLFPSIGSFLYQDSIIYVFSQLFVLLFHYLLQLREQSMSEVYADTIVILEHLKLVHVFCVLQCLVARGKEILSGNIQTTGVMHSCLSVGHFIKFSLLIQEPVTLSLVLVHIHQRN